VAKAIATISGIGLVPGVSKNRRLYTPEMVERATNRLAERIKTGNAPANMLSHHAAGDDSREITATLTGARLDEGRLRFDGAITATKAGEDIANLADISDGKPAHLKNVSIRGYWLGTVRKVKGPDGQPVETADDMEIDGIDWTKSPGVTGAEIDTFAWADRSGRTETTERIFITESVQEARVTISEETAPAAPLVLTEAERTMLPFAGAPHVLENGACSTCAAVAEGGDAPGDGSKPFGNVVYADPGYQADKQKRYPVDTKAHVKAALSYLAQKSNAAKYTAAQLKRVMGRIRAAAKKFGITTAAESAGWSFDAPVQLTEALAEHLGDTSRAGSWSVRASNGPVDICLSSWGMDPEDLDVILRAAADAACKALAALDPDMDGDVDVPGVGDGSDPDNDAPGESAPDGDGMTDPDPAAAPAAATTETEDPAMTAETTTPAAGSTPAVDPKTLAEAVATALAEQETARQARKAAKREKAAKAATEAARIATESAALGQGAPATTGASATETEDQRRARLAALVEAQFAAKAQAEGLATEKTDEQLVAEMIEERMVPLRQGRAEAGGVQRKGLAPLEAIADSPTAGKLLENATNEDLSHTAAAAYGPRRR
jgi:hypothetical protein